MSRLQTPLTRQLGLKHPIILAGMARTSGGPLAAAVSNAGGCGVVGGLGYTPQQLQDILTELKSNLDSPDLPFGVDLALPQVGGSARKTNRKQDILFTSANFVVLVQFQAAGWLTLSYR